MLTPRCPSQDHDSFLMHQCHRNYVNLYICITKPDPLRSGLSLIPASTMRREFPELWPSFEFGGAKRRRPQQAVSLQSPRPQQRAVAAERARRQGGYVPLPHEVHASDSVSDAAPPLRYLPASHFLHQRQDSLER